METPLILPSHSSSEGCSSSNSQIRPSSSIASAYASPSFRKDKKCVPARASLSVHCRVLYSPPAQTAPYQWTRSAPLSSLYKWKQLSTANPLFSNSIFLYMEFLVSLIGSKRISSVCSAQSSPGQRADSDQFQDNLLLQVSDHFSSVQKSADIYRHLLPLFPDTAMFSRSVSGSDIHRRCSHIRRNNRSP